MDSRLKRQRRKPKQFEQQSTISQAEQRALRQALENSQALQKREFIDVPMAPIFHPTLEEFADPIKYIASIRDRASKHGICKIVPPKGWNPPSCYDKCFQGKQNLSFPTKKQYVHKLQEGTAYGEGRNFRIDDFKSMSDAFRAQTVATMIEKGRCSYREPTQSGGVGSGGGGGGGGSSKSSAGEKGSMDDTQVGTGGGGGGGAVAEVASSSSFVSTPPSPSSSSSSSKEKPTPTSSSIPPMIASPITNAAAAASFPSASSANTSASLASTQQAHQHSANPSQTSSSTPVPPKGEAYVSMLDLEKEYWRIVETADNQVEVEYGSDLDAMTYGTGWPLHREVGAPVTFDSADVPCDFTNPDYYAKTGWNLNNLPHWPGSVLRHIKGNYNGINVPWVYVGMLFGTFAWHNEDNYLYSISYNHSGASKVWYGVPGKQAHKLETCMRSFLMDRFREVSDTCTRAATASLLALLALLASWWRACCCWWWLEKENTLLTVFFLLLFFCFFSCCFFFTGPRFNLSFSHNDWSLHLGEQKH